MSPYMSMINLATYKSTLNTTPATAAAAIPLNVPKNSQVTTTANSISVCQWYLQNRCMFIFHTKMKAPSADRNPIIAIPYIFTFLGMVA